MQLLARFFEYSPNDDLRFFFFNKGFLTSPEFGEFVAGLTTQFSFHDGFMLNAGEFVGTSQAWGIIFSHWALEGEKKQKTFPFKVLSSTSSKEVTELTEWTARKVEKEETLTFWMKELGQNPIDKDKPGTKGGFEAPDTKTDRSRMGIDALGVIMQSGNTVAKSNKFMGLFTLGVAQGNNYDVTRENFERAAVTFSIRRAAFISLSRHKQEWIRDKDIFKRPPKITLTNEFIADCVVHSLFDSQSNQTSLRNYEYNGNMYRVENEFFPFSIDFVNQLAIENNNLDIQADLQGDEERFVYAWLKEHDEYLSPEATQLLGLAKQLYEETFPYRDEYAKLQPRFQTNSWDAGYAQIARLAFGNDRINDEFLVLKEQFYDARARLGEKIAQAAIEDGVI